MQAETKQERFMRLAEKRTNGIIDSIRVLGNLANHRHYEYTNEDVEKIFSTINRELRRTRNKFSDSKNLKQAFSLKEGISEPRDH